MIIYQKTLKKEVTRKGIGLHTGKEVILTLKPAQKSITTMLVEITVDAERTPCTGTCDQLIQTFRDKRITAVKVGNLPQQISKKHWFKKCFKHPGMVETQKYGCFCWHEFKTPEQACKFMVTTHGKVYKGNKLTADGTHHDGMTFQEILAKTREHIDEKQSISLQ